MLNERSISIGWLIEFYHCIDSKRVAGEEICGISKSFCIIGEGHGFKMTYGGGINLSWICGDDSIGVALVIMTQVVIVCLL